MKFNTLKSRSFVPEHKKIRKICESYPLKLADLRKSYEFGALHEEDLAKDPLEQLDRWFKAAEAAGVAEFNAMTLCTVGSDGRPSSRIVLIKGLDTGLVWYTNYQSRKAEELAIHPFACLQFHFIAQERQIRVEGMVEKVSAAESDAYFASRPRASKIGAWASPQSQEIVDREMLAKAEQSLALQFGDEIPRPAHWGGYRLKPDRFEFWQGRPSRLHDRLIYRKSPSGSWDIRRLAP